MSKFLRWLKIGLGSLVALILVAYLAIYVISEREMRHVWTPAPVAITVPSDSASIAEGRRLVAIRGCTGCHGKQLQGDTLVDELMLATLYAPNLTASAQRYSNAELAQIIREGVRPDGHGVLAMPSRSFHGMTDADLALTLAYVRSFPPVPGLGPHRRLGPLGRFGLSIGQFKTMPRMISEAVPLPPAADSQAAQGRYLAQTVCNECHGPALKGDEFFASSNLRVLRAYSPEDFTKLMRTGVPLGGRKLGMMGEVAKVRFVHFTDAEVAALYAYLHTLPD
jgi:mono/diheme cytochrome c family protein